MTDAEQILREQGVMETRRSNFEQLWQEVASLMLPRQADFLTAGTAFAGFNQGQARTESIFEETAMLSLDHGCAVFEGEVIPQGGTWQRLRDHDPDLMKKRHVAEWYEKITRRMFALRNAPRSGFANQTHESVASLLSFGLQGMTVDHLKDARGMPVGLRYISEHIGQLYVREDAAGMVEASHKKFRWSHRKAMAFWREDQWPECVRKAAEKGDKALDDEATYIHRLAPTPTSLYDPDRIDHRGKPISSCYISVDDRQVFDVGGFRTRPLTISRYEKSPMEDYGRSPAINCLPAVRSAQVIKQSLVTAVEFLARPALGAHDDLLDELIMYAPGGISYGAIDDRGNPMIRKLLDDPDISAAAQLLGETQKVIQRSFFEDLYIVRQELKSHISATEQLQRDAQRGIMLAPLKRQENEWFTPQVDRELDLMNDMGMLDDMPPEVREAGGLFSIEYDNPLEIARNASEASAFYETLNGLTPLMQLQPQATVPQFFREFPFARILDSLAAIRGVPTSFRATDEEKAATDAESEARVKSDTALNVGERAADIAAKFAQAAPTPQPGGASA